MEERHKCPRQPCLRRMLGDIFYVCTACLPPVEEEVE